MQLFATDSNSLCVWCVVCGVWCVVCGVWCWGEREGVNRVIYKCSQASPQLFGHIMRLGRDLGTRSCSSAFVTTLTNRLYTTRHNNMDPLFNLGCTVDKVVFPEVVARVLDQLDEGDEQSPGVRSVHNQTLQQNTAGEETDKDSLILSLRGSTTQGKAW